MQDSLFDDEPNAPATPRRTGTSTARVQPAPADQSQRSLAAALPRRLRLGTSSWYFPGWAGMVWDGAYEPSQLSKHGLAAYAQHPLFRAVSIDRSFYRPLPASQFAAYAAQDAPDFRLS